MESIRKIMMSILLGLIFMHSLDCTGQNIYGSETIYYNMDTLRCIDNDSRFWEGDKLISDSGNPDSATLYCTFKKNIDIPIVTVNDYNLVRILDTCLYEVSKYDYLHFPDSSGYFVEIRVFDRQGDSSKFGLSINPIPNYYMADILSSFRDDAYNEWFGYNEKNVQGCFFLKNILYVITSYGWVDYNRASCLFSQTESTIKLSLYSPIRRIVTNERWNNYSYFFHNCKTNEE